ncbi:polysaccharide lyase beta-sandwich domain-containing protein [Amycolatopsis acidiphila]|uniref:polysaccharide lyase beta-sandwich domain-containing protein n=1 Tax=Amycolatopsis acidiphila TaxID=715473 RepID=UPI001C954652
MPGCGVVEVEPAGTVQGFFWSAGRVSTGKNRVLVTIPAGQICREPPGGGRSGVAQPTQRQHRAVGKVTTDVSKRAVMTGGDTGQGRPPVTGSRLQALTQRDLG